MTSRPVEKVYGCPVEFTLDLLGGKWKAVVLARLKERPMRYSELRRAIPTVADKVLTGRLRDLVDAGFVEHAVSGGASLYSLSDKGRSLQPVLTSLYDWGLAAAGPAGARFRPADDAGDP